MYKRTWVQMNMAIVLFGQAGFGQDASSDRGIKNPAVSQQERAKKIQDQVAKPRPDPAGTSDAPKDSQAALILCMNLWHMRLADSASPVKSRGLTHKKIDPSGKLDWTPERMTLDDVIPEGELLRLSFESASAGYLYVIDRDIFADGTKSAP